MAVVNRAAHSYIRPMAARSEFAIPVKGDKVPSGPDWLHEIKHDGYRMKLLRENDRVRLYTKGGFDWTKRYPWIVESALKIRTQQFVLDGEAVVLNVDGMSDFDALHSRKHDHEVQFYAFDILSGDGDDYRRLPLSMRKANLARLLARRAEGVFLAPSERGEIGPDLFRHACIMGLEGMVSKHADRAYSPGRCTHWIKNKNPQHPAYSRVKDQF
ncbi:bifunctional non-homologous end joining protein LigD [Bradyrhizobium ottawaense]